MQVGKARLNKGSKSPSKNTYSIQEKMEMTKGQSGIIQKEDVINNHNMNSWNIQEEN